MIQSMTFTTRPHDYCLYDPQTQQLNDHGAAGRVSREKMATTMGVDVYMILLLYAYDE